MRLDQVKELVEKGLTNAAIASAVNMSIRQVQRLKRRLLEAPVKLPKNTGQLIKLLQKKAAQGDLLSIRTLLKEYRATEEEQTQKGPNLDNFTEEERRRCIELLREIINKEKANQQNGSKEGQEATSKDLLLVKIPTPPSLPSGGSTGEEDPKPPSPAVGNTPGESDQTHSHLVNTPEGREHQLSPLVNPEPREEKRGGLRVIKDPKGNDWS